MILIGMGLAAAVCFVLSFGLVAGVLRLAARLRRVRA